jgi:uncharacterized protein YutE (UPF0331/DUF86 family)
LADPEIVTRRLREMGRRLAALRALRAGDPDEFLRDLALQAQAERHLQLALQSAIDVALHLLAEDTDRTPQDYGSAFLLLADEEVVPADLAARLRLAAGLRNLLVHAYLEIDPAQVWRHLDRLDDLEAFARLVQNRLDRAAGPTP